VQLFKGLVSPAAFAARAMSARAASNTTLRLGVVAVVTTLVVVACDRVNLTAPTGSTISVSVDRSVVPLNGLATVTAVVTESAGTPVHNGTAVTFQTTVGSLNPPTVETVNGIATTTFVAGQTSGVATIHAFSGGARTGSGNTSSGGATIRVGTAAASGAISLTATPSSVSQSGGTVTISALVFDEQSNPLPGIPVQFVSSTGSLSPTSATTDSNGIARTQLSTTQTATVNAIAGAAKGEVRVEASAAPSITVNASDGTAGTPVPITITFSGGTSGNSSPRQIATLVVDFGDGTSETRSNVTGSVAMTHTYQNAGGYTVTARATDVAGNTGIASDVTIIGFAQQPTVGLTASKNNPAVNEVFTMTVTPTAANANTPIRSVVVRTNDGTVLYSGTGGTATFPVQFTSSGTRVITATATDAAGQTGSTTTTIIVP
jgi:hypothetical protein